MVSATHTGSSAGFTDWMHVVRSRGVFSGVLLGVWGGLVAFVGPYFGYAYTPAETWDFTMGRLWLEILPRAATVLGGLILLSSANRVLTLFGGTAAQIGFFAGLGVVVLALAAFALGRVSVISSRDVRAAEPERHDPTKHVD